MDLNKYANQLYARRHEAIDIEHLSYCGTDGWEPQPRSCHDNVARFIDEKPDYTEVHGWYVCDLADQFTFLAHSIVQSSNGAYINITPLGVGVSWEYQFLKDDDPNYWTIAQSAPGGNIMCSAEGRSQQDIEARERVIVAEKIDTVRRWFGS